MFCKNVLDMIGDTPLVRILSRELDNVNLYAKLEYYNPTGSVKDRAASYIISKVLSTGEIDKNTKIIESSSGNFGVALAAICKSYGLKFTCVIDPCINPINEVLISKLDANVMKVTEPDENGGYLLNRIRRVKEQLCLEPNSYWVNQYENPHNADAYYYYLGEEICNSMNNIDYIFMGVSSGGTITGVSRKIKEKFPNAQVIAVDINGSVIFGENPHKRYIPGIGSSMVPLILKKALIDEVVMVDEISTVNACYELLNENMIFAGGSSGSVYYAIKKYFNDKKFSKKPDVVCIFADRGDRYSTTIYNECWRKEFCRICLSV